VLDISINQLRSVKARRQEEKKEKETEKEKEKEKEQQFGIAARWQGSRERKVFKDREFTGRYSCEQKGGG